MADKNNQGKSKDKKAPDTKSGGRGDAPARSSNPADWKNEPGNQS